MTRTLTTPPATTTPTTTRTDNMIPVCLPCYAGDTIRYINQDMIYLICLSQRRIKLQDSQLNEIPQYLVRPCVKSPTVARAARDFRYQDNTGTLSPVSLERANIDCVGV